MLEISKSEENSYYDESTTCITPHVCSGALLENNDYELILEHDIPLNHNDWTRLDFLTEEENLPYSINNIGDTQEALSMKVFRIKKQHSQEIYHPELMSLIGSQEMLDFYRKICNNDKLFIDRCQAHLYKKDDFIARHIDRDSYEAYEFSLLIAISQDFTGGEIVLYSPKMTHKFKIPNRSILIADSGIPHEVLPIKSGIRKTIALFLMQEGA